jgi:hypothetical protein
MFEIGTNLILTHSGWYQRMVLSQIDSDRSVVHAPEIIFDFLFCDRLLLLAHGTQWIGSVGWWSFFKGKAMPIT